VLINHGLFTFAQTAKESYDYHIEAVTKAEGYIAKHPVKELHPAGLSIGSKSPEEIFRTLAPVLRGILQEESGASWLVQYRPNEHAYRFASSEECTEWSQIGTATPDHVIRTKQKPLLLNLKNLDDANALWNEVHDGIKQYMDVYHAYFTKNRDAKGVEKKELDRLPRVLLVAGLGLVTIGKTAKETRIAADIYEHSIDIIHKAFNVGSYRPLGDADLFDMEYWSLEQAKLGKAKPPVLNGKVVYVTGAASGIGRATAHLFAEQGANVFLTDINEELLNEAADAIKQATKANLLARVVDVTDEKAVRESFEQVVQHFGGLDMLISNAGNAVQGPIGEVDPATLRRSFELNFFAHQTLASQSVRLFKTQRTGGVLLFNASKAAFNPGKNFGPYALPKAGVMALTKQYALDYGADGIRSNAVNADRIRTGIFPPDFVEQRAAARGLSADEYFKDNLLRREVLDRDVAQAFLDLALAEKTTGSVFTVDGGNIAASPR
jgi:NAD(P)-dependent dehydrogenase (short-subunit alcohol dehydrogenase family)